MVAQTYHPSTQEVKAEDELMANHHPLYSKFKVSPG